MPNEFVAKNGLIAQSNSVVSGSLVVTNGITGSLFGTSSQALSASYTATSSFGLNAISASYAFTASSATNAFQAVSSSFASTASSAQNASDILLYVKNSSGAQINKGRVVRIAGAVGDNALITTASYFSDNESANTLGITNETIANDSFGYVITEGTLIGINTAAFTAGQLIYLGDTGSIIGTAPLAPLHAVRLGQVLRSQLNNGSIYVRIDNGFEIGELHDVKDTTTTGSYGDLLIKSGSIWINSKQLTGSYGLTGSLNVSGSITGSLFGTASQSVSASYAFTASSAISSSFALRGNGSFTGSFSGSVTASLFGTASQATSASYAYTASSAIQAATATTASTVIASVTGTNSTELVRGNMADNDQFRILVGGTGTNAGFAEIATADDGTEPIHVRQYTGVFASLVRTATLLDGSGNTSFPGTVSATFSGNLTGTASFASNYLGSGSISTRLTSLETASGSFSTRTTNTEVTASNLTTASGSFSTRITSDSSSFSSRVSSIEATTASLQVASGSFSTRVTQIERTYATTGSNIFTGSQNILGAVTASAALINGTITAQTLVVTTVSSSVVFSSGSNIFGNSTANTQTMTGSLNVSGSATIIGRVTATNLTGSLFGTASQAVSSSYALTASFALNGGGGVSFPYTGSAQITGSLGVTGSFSVSANQGSSVFSSNADTLLITGSLVITGSGAITGSLSVSNGITGSLFGTASQAITASYALTASYVASIAGLSTSQIATGSVTASVGQSTASFQLVSGSTNFLYVSNSGNVGINNAAPSLLSGGNGLSVSGSSYTQLQLKGAGAGGIEFVPSTGDTWEIQAANATVTPNSFIIYNRSDNAYRLLIDGSGNVAIGGSTRPSASLDVSGSVRITNGLSETGSVNISGSLTVTGSITTNGTITAQTLVVQTVTGSFTGSFTGSLFGTASQALTASYAMGGSASSILFQTASAATTWSFNHFLQTQYPVFTIYDEGNNVIVPQQITAVDTSSALIYFSSPKRGVAVASKGGYSASVVTSATTANTAITASYALFALSASNAPGFTFTFSQSLSAVTWSINHNMNTRTPLVQVYDINYNQLIPNQVVSVTQNLTEVRFDYGQNGYAVLSSGMAPFVTGSTSLLNQTIPAVTWSFAHNLNTKYVNFEVYDANDYVMLPSAIRVIDTNNAEIHLAYSTTGRAVANFSGINGQMNAQTASLALTASFVRPLSQSVAITGSGTTNSTLDITGIRTNSAVNPPVGTISLYYPGADGATANVHGASIMFSQRYDAASAVPIGIGMIAGVKVNPGGNFGGGLTFWTSNQTNNNLAERMRIDASGSVGIGLTSPRALLHISGSSLSASLFQVSSTSNNNALVVSGSGNVGVSKANPAATLDVSGSMLVTGSYAMSGSFTQVGYKILTTVSQSLNYSDDTAAAAGGVPLGGLYRNGNFILIRLS